MDIILINQDLLHDILLKLNSKWLFNLMMINKELNQKINNQDFWKKKIIYDYKFIYLENKLQQKLKDKIQELFPEKKITVHSEIKDLYEGSFIYPEDVVNWKLQYKKEVIKSYIFDTFFIYVRSDNFGGRNISNNLILSDPYEFYKINNNIINNLNENEIDNTLFLFKNLTSNHISVYIKHGNYEEPFLFFYSNNGDLILM